jgi:hypothetical protein
VNALRILTASITGLFLAGAPAFAQQRSVVPRADVAGHVAWQFVEVDSDGPFINHEDWHSSLFGGVSAGWHWTPHWKSEIDLGASTQANTYRTTTTVVGGHEAYLPSRLRFSRRTLGLSHQYQFFENDWFHPHVAAGVNLTWERRTEDFERPIIIGPSPLPPGPVERRTEGPFTEFAARPFIATGAKVYLTERAFFRADVRFAFHGGLDETLTRFGFGFDF